jgi:hypothetical protein
LGKPAIRHAPFAPGIAQYIELSAAILDNQPVEYHESMVSADP